MKVKEVTEKDLAAFCDRYVRKEHTCLNCPLFKIEGKVREVRGFGGSGVSGSSNACSILRGKWELERALEAVNDDLEYISEKELSDHKEPSETYYKILKALGFKIEEELK